MGSWQGEGTQAPVAEMSQGEGLCLNGKKQQTARLRKKEIKLCEDLETEIRPWSTREEDTLHLGRKGS